MIYLKRQENACNKNATKILEETATQLIYTILQFLSFRARYFVFAIAHLVITLLLPDKNTHNKHTS